MQHDRLYGYLELARARVLDAARPLSAEQYNRSFPIGPGTLARTLTHIMICEWMYIERIAARPVPPYRDWPIHDEDPPPFAVIDAEWKRQAERTRAAIAAVSNWPAPLEYRYDGDDGSEIITTTREDIFTQLVLHEVHHRAQAINMLRHLGVTVGDVDFNDFMYQRRKVVS